MAAKKKVNEKQEQTKMATETDDKVGQRSVDYSNKEEERVQEETDSEHLREQLLPKRTNQINFTQIYLRFSSKIAALFTHYE